MILHKKELLTATEKRGLSLWFLAVELGIPVAKLNTMLDGEERFTYDQSKRMMEIFGAETMVKVINWEALNVCCPL